MKSKEVIVFMMACYSGNLVDSFRRKQDEIDRWKSEGRTLFVMSSSGGDETSSTGPGINSAEPADITGSAGSAFGFQLWRAIKGDADGFGAGGRKDGVVTLGEIRDYAIAETVRASRHTPEVIGVFDPDLPMTRPSANPEADDIWSEIKERFKVPIDRLHDKIGALEAEGRQVRDQIMSRRHEARMYLLPDDQVAFEALDQQIIGYQSELRELCGYTVNDFYSGDDTQDILPPQNPSSDRCGQLTGKVYSSMFERSKLISRGLEAAPDEFKAELQNLESKRAQISSESGAALQQINDLEKEMIDEYLRQTL